MNLSAVWKSSYGNSPPYEIVDLDQSRKPSSVVRPSFSMQMNVDAKQPSLNGTLRVANLGAVPD
jgi:hypothetical protein